MRNRVEMLRARDIAPMLGVGVRRVLQLAREGWLPAVRAGRAVRFPRLALETCFRRWADQALHEMSGLRPRLSTDQALVLAVHRLAGDSPFGWEGTASALRHRLEEYRPEEAESLARWPADARSLAVALRRVVATLGSGGVRVAIGRRGHRGVRLISIVAFECEPAGTTASAASRRASERAAPGAAMGSARSHGGRGGDRFTGVLMVDSQLLAEHRRRTNVSGELSGGAGTEVADDE
jgi:excisionase family DNA binding protein